MYLEYDEGVELFAAKLAGLVPAGAVIAVDELTGAMRRNQHRLFADGPRATRARIVPAAKAVKTPDEVACMRRALRITEQAMADVQRALAPGVRQMDLSRPVPPPRVRTRRRGQPARPDLAGDADQPGGRLPWTIHGDLALPAADHRARAGPG